MRKTGRVVALAAVASAAAVLLATAAARIASRHAPGPVTFAKPTAASRAVPKPHSLSPRSQDASDYLLAGNARGDVAVVWQVSVPRGHSHLWFRRRPAGGHWSRARDLSRGYTDAWAHSLAVAPDGTVLLFWSKTTYPARRTKDKLSVLHPGGHLHAAKLAHGLDAPDNVAVAADGTAIAAWTHWSRPRVQIRAAVRSPAGRWSKPQVVAQGKRNLAEPQVAVDGTGNATLVWERWPAGEIERDDPPPLGQEQYQIRAAVRPAGGRFGHGKLLSNPKRDAIGAFLAVGRRGDTAVFWASQTFNYVADRIGYTTRVSDGSFARPRWLTRPGQGESAAAVIDGQGDMTAIWNANRPCGHRHLRCGHLVAARRPFGDDFGPARPIGGREFDPGEIATDSQGGGLAIRTSPGSKRNDFRGRVEGRYLSASGTIGPHRRFSTVGDYWGESALLADNGVATVVWLRIVHPSTSRAHDSLMWARTRVQP